MATRTPAGMANPSTVPNTSLMYTGWLHDPLRRPEDVRALNIKQIIVGKRERGLDYEKISKLASSIKTEGLLQPIGVRQGQEYNKYDLIYGYHRLAACSMLNKEDPTEGRIVAVIFPKEMPDWACKLAEVAENIARVDLTQEQREGQMLIYAGLLKKHGLVADAKDAQGRANQYTKPKVEMVHSEPAPKSKPSISQKITEDLGITRGTFRRQVLRGKKVAEKAGLVIPPDEQTPETMKGDTMIAIGEKMAEATKTERKEAIKELPRQTSQVLGSTQSRPILNTIDPKPFIDWCRARIKGEHKPMSIDILKAYRKALDELIAEIEAK